MALINAGKPGGVDVAMSEEYGILMGTSEIHARWVPRHLRARTERVVWRGLGARHNGFMEVK
jgi:hypothetical protein